MTGILLFLKGCGRQIATGRKSYFAWLAVLLVAGWAYHTANRLDRLNVRVDLARQALEQGQADRVLALASAEDTAPVLLSWKQPSHTA